MTPSTRSDGRGNPALLSKSRGRWRHSIKPTTVIGPISGETISQVPDQRTAEERAHDVADTRSHRLCIVLLLAFGAMPGTAENHRARDRILADEAVGDRAPACIRELHQGH